MSLHLVSPEQTPRADEKVFKAYVCFYGCQGGTSNHTRPSSLKYNSDSVTRGANQVSLTGTVVNSYDQPTFGYLTPLCTTQTLIVPAACNTKRADQRLSLLLEIVVLFTFF